MKSRIRVKLTLILRWTQSTQHGRMLTLCCVILARNIHWYLQPFHKPIKEDDEEKNWIKQKRGKNGRSERYKAKNDMKEKEKDKRWWKTCLRWNWDKHEVNGAEECWHAVPGCLFEKPADVTGHFTNLAKKAREESTEYEKYEWAKQSLKAWRNDVETETNTTVKTGTEEWQMHDSQILIGPHSDWRTSLMSQTPRRKQEKSRMR